MARRSLAFGLLAVACLSGCARGQEDEASTGAAAGDSASSTASASSTENHYHLPQLSKNEAHFFEPFPTGQEDEYSRWVKSTSRKDKIDASEIEKYDGIWGIESTNVSGMAEDYALVLKSAAKHHGIAVRLDRPYLFAGKPFVFQYDVKFTNGQECGGGYVKLVQQKALSNLEELNDKIPYTIMFGPDKCGKDAHLHFIFQHRNPKTGAYEEKKWKEPTTLKIEELISSKKSHVYTLVVQPDNTFKVFVDQKIVGDGSLLSDVTPAVNPVAEIEDPHDTKPQDWDERKTIADPHATKPEAWNEDAPTKISDSNAAVPEGWLENEKDMVPDATVDQPEDWDVDMDGEWEPPLIENPKCKGVGCGKWTAPLIDNPECKASGCGPWTAPVVDNPNFKGKWAPRKIPNPQFFEDKEPYKMTPIDTLALELWSISNNVVFDNFLVTDDIDVADRIARETWGAKEQREGASESILSFDPERRPVTRTGNESVPGGKLNYKYIGIAVAVVVGLFTLVTMRKKSRQRMPPMGDFSLPPRFDVDEVIRPKADDKSAGDEKRNVAEDDDSAPPGLEGDEGAGDNPDSAPVSGESGSEAEREPLDETAQVVEETKESKVTKRRARRE